MANGDDRQMYTLSPKSQSFEYQRGKEIANIACIYLEAHRKRALYRVSWGWKAVASTLLWDMIPFDILFQFERSIDCRCRERSSFAVTIERTGWIDAIWARWDREDLYFPMGDENIEKSYRIKVSAFEKVSLKVLCKRIRSNL